MTANTAPQVAAVLGEIIAALESSRDFELGMAHGTFGTPERHRDVAAGIDLCIDMMRRRRRELGGT